MHVNVAEYIGKSHETKSLDIFWSHKQIVNLYEFICRWFTTKRRDYLGSQNREDLFGIVLSFKFRVDLLKLGPRQIWWGQKGM